MILGGVVLVVSYRWLPNKKVRLVLGFTYEPGELQTGVELVGITTAYPSFVEQLISIITRMSA